MASYVSEHAEMPAALTLEYERVLCPLLLDRHNGYAGAEWVTGAEPTPALHQKGLIDRSQCAFVQEAILRTLRTLLVEGRGSAAGMDASLSCAADAARELLGGEVDSSELAEGGFLKRADQRDLIRMARLAGATSANADDKTLSRQNCYALAIELLRESAVDGTPTRVFRQGEYVPFVLVKKSGGAGKAAQFENVSEPHGPVLHGTPVDLRLLYTNRLLPAFFGQARERTGGTTKGEAVEDKPAMLGRLLSADRLADFRREAGRRATDGVLTCEEGYRLFGLAQPPRRQGGTAEGGGSSKGGAQQAKLSSFFSKKPGAPTPTPAQTPPRAGGAVSYEPPTDPPTPSGEAPVAATPRRGAKDAAEEARRLEALIGELRARRAGIARASGHLGGPSEPLLLHNLAAPLANATRLLSIAHRSSATGSS
jgi:hypothetical protein